MTAERGFAAHFAQAVIARGVTLTWLRDRLADRGNPVSLATLSSWRAGSRNPEGATSLAAVADLEHLLALPVGDLTDRLRRSRRVRPPVRGVLAEDASYDRTAVEETIAALDLADPGGLRDRSSHVTLDVDASGEHRRTILRAIVEAQLAQVRDCFMMLYSPEPMDQPPRIIGLRGCRTVRDQLHPGRRVYGAALALDRPLAYGESTVVEIEQLLPPGFSSDDSYEQTVTRRNHEIVIWARFDPARVPRTYEEYTQVDGARRVDLRRAVTGTSCHLTRSNFGPGTVGLRWEF